MKKFFLTFFSLALSIVLCFSLAGCNGCNESVLAFSNNFSGQSGTAPTNYTEVLTYDIDYVEDYNNGYVIKSANLTDNVIKCDYSGKLVQTFEIVSILPSWVNEKDHVDVGQNRIYHLTSEATINATYYLNGSETPQVFTDKVYQEVYFLPANMSFAPIYSKVEQENTLVHYYNDSNATSLIRYKYLTETTYGNKNYTMDKAITEFLGSENEKTTTSSTQRKYDFRQVIDNTQFIFATRNVNISQDASVSLPVQSLSYGYPVSLLIKNVNERTLPALPLTYNGTSITEDVQIQEFAYRINSSKNAGAAQFVLVQKQGTEKLPYNALPIQIVETLTTYSSFESLGALVYTLTDVAIVK